MSENDQDPGPTPGPPRQPAEDGSPASGSDAAPTPAPERVMEGTRKPIDSAPKPLEGAPKPSDGVPKPPDGAPRPPDGAPKPQPKPAPGPSAAEVALRAAAPSVPLDRLRDRFSEIAARAVFFARTPIVLVPVARLVEVCRFLKEDPQADCRYLSNLHGNHDPARPKPFEVIYNLYSVRFGHGIMMKVEVADGEEVPSVTTVWKTADWHEREAFDLFGIRFAGHPNMTRILLPDTWVGHPLRKEYPLEGKDGDHPVYRRE